MTKLQYIYNKVKKIIYPVYAVGGCVRDELIGVEPKDYDFACPFSPDEIEKAIKNEGRRAYLIGKKFGTLGVKIEGNYIELTAFRTEEYKRNCRKPNVEFVKDLHSDLSRRDFTINAIAKIGNKYIDPFNGREDLETRTLKCVGNTKLRFKEDPLRMLRAARFISQLKLINVDEAIWKKTLELNYRILTVSKERWMIELDKLLLSDNINLGLDFLMITRLFNFMIPELALQLDYNQNSKYHDYDLWTHTKQVVYSTPKDLNLRWSALLHDIAKPFVRTNKVDRSNYIHHARLGSEIVEKIANYLKWSNDRRKVVKDLVLNHLNEDSILKPYDDKFKKKTK